MTWVQEDNSINKMQFKKKMAIEEIKAGLLKHKEMLRLCDLLLTPEQITRYMREQKRINIPNKFDTFRET